MDLLKEIEEMTAPLEVQVFVKEIRVEADGAKLLVLTWAVD